MIIYIDLVILSTVVVNTLIIMGIECIFNDKVSLLRIIISNILSVFFLAFFLFSLKSFLFLRYFIGILIGYLSFNKCILKNKIIKIVLYYMFNISLVGVLEIFNIRNMGLLVISTIFIISLGIIISFRNVNELLVKVNNKNLIALYDSGNSCFYNNLPVVYLDYKYLNVSFKYIDKILIETINGKTFINIYKGPVFKINNKIYNVYYSFSNINDFDIILHKDLGGKRCLNY